VAGAERPQIVSQQLLGRSGGAGRIPRFAPQGRQVVTGGEGVGVVGAEAVVGGGNKVGVGGAGRR
jgi:hypothetical protein